MTLVSSLFKIFNPFLPPFLGPLLPSCYATRSHYVAQVGPEFGLSSSWDPRRMPPCLVRHLTHNHVNLDLLILSSVGTALRIPGEHSLVLKRQLHVCSRKSKEKTH